MAEMNHASHGLQDDEAERRGASRFQVLHSQPRGSKKQRQWRDGSLKVGFHAATLFDNEEHRAVTSQHGSGLMPNKVFQKMKSAHGGLDWDPRARTRSHCDEGPSCEPAEVWIGPNYLVQILEVMELHLLPYGMLPSVENGAALPRATVSPAAASEIPQVAPGSSTAERAISEAAAWQRTLEPFRRIPVRGNLHVFPSQRPTASSRTGTTPGWDTERIQPQLHALRRRHRSPSGEMSEDSPEKATAIETWSLAPQRVNAAPPEETLKKPVGKQPKLDGGSENNSPSSKRKRDRSSLLTELKTNYSQFF